MSENNPGSNVHPLADFPGAEVCGGSVILNQKTMGFMVSATYLRATEDGLSYLAEDDEPEPEAPVKKARRRKADLAPAEPPLITPEEAALFEAENALLSTP